MERINVALRYCGGCNPRYDRRELADSLKEQFPQIRLSPYCGAETCAAALVICGCPAQCAAREDLPLPYLVLSSPADRSRAAAFLADTLRTANHT